MRDYRRAGLAPCLQTKRKEVEQLRKQLAKLGTEFGTEHCQRERAGRFHKSRSWMGCRRISFAKPGIKTGDDAYTVLANVTWQFVAVEEDAKSEATRKKLS